MEHAALYVVAYYVGFCIIVLAVGVFTLWILRKLREQLLRDRDDFLRKWDKPWKED